MLHPTLSGPLARLWRSPVCLKVGALTLMILLSAQCWGQNSVAYRESFVEKPLMELLPMLKEKYALELAYSETAVRGVLIKGPLQASSLPHLFQQLLDGTSLEFQLTGSRMVMIRPRSGQDDAHGMRRVFGQVFDEASHTPLPYATISQPAANLGVVADSLGGFSLMVPDTLQQLRVSYLGFSPRWVILPPKGEPMHVPMKSTVRAIAQVVISDASPTFSTFAAPATWGIRPAKLRAFPVGIAGTDVFRSLQLLPGISASDDLSAEINIRGSSGDQNLVVLDGITLYEIDHYFGVFSVTNPNIISDARVYKNYFPIEYGGRTAGVIELNPFDAQTEKFQGSLELNRLITSGGIRVPLTNNMGILLGGRLTLKNLGETEVFEVVDPAPTNFLDKIRDKDALLKEYPEFRFYDWNVKWEWEPLTGHSLSVHRFYSYDRFRYDIDRKYALGKRVRQTRVEETYDEDGDWQNEGTSIRSVHRWNERMNTRLTASWSSYLSNQEVSTLVTRQPVLDRDTTLEIANIQNAAFNSISSFSLNALHEAEIMPGHQISLGYQYTRYQVGYEFQADYLSHMEGDNEATEEAVYGQYTWDFASNSNLTLGLRANRYGPTGEWYLSPRVYLTHALHPQLSLKASGSRYYQFLQQAYYENRLGRTFDFWVLAEPDKIPVSTANHLMAGATWHHPNFTFDVEVYNKSIDGMVEMAPLYAGFDKESGAPVPGRDDYSVFIGSGRTYGLDLLLSHEGNVYEGWLTYTLSKSTQRFPEIFDGASFPAQNDRRHQLKWGNLIKKGRWSLAADYIFSSGRPYTDLGRIMIERSDRRTLSAQDRIGYLPDYHRMDAGLYYRLPIGKTSALLGMSVFNLFDRANVKYQQYLYAYWNPGEREKEVSVLGNEYQLLGRTFNLTLRWEW